MTAIAHFIDVGDLIILSFIVQHQTQTANMDFSFGVHAVICTTNLDIDLQVNASSNTCITIHITAYTKPVVKSA